MDDNNNDGRTLSLRVCFPPSWSLPTFRALSNHIEVKLFLPVDYPILSAPQSTPKLHRTEILHLS
ncbi:hypothetical protein SESBI_03912 [Sesbania bispinosa]|nr:hypothetical protein SESBI_03912 [Sesbania bispinosa]